MTNVRKTVMCLLLGGSLWLLSEVGSVAADLPTSNTTQRIREQLSRNTGVTEEIAERFNATYGHAVLENGIAMLNENYSPKTKGKICLYLAKYPINNEMTTHPASCAIISFIRNITADSIDSNERMPALSYAIGSLGFCKDKQSRDYLSSLASTKYWEKCSFQPNGKQSSVYGTVQSCKNALRKSALYALAYSGKPEALNEIEKLKTGDAKDLLNIFDAVTEELKDRQSGEYLKKRKKVSPIL